MIFPSPLCFHSGPAPLFICCVGLRASTACVWQFEHYFTEFNWPIVSLILKFNWRTYQDPTNVNMHTHVCHVPPHAIVSRVSWAEKHFSWRMSLSIVLISPLRRHEISLSATEASASFNPNWRRLIEHPGKTAYVYSLLPFERKVWEAHTKPATDRHYVFNTHKCTLAHNKRAHDSVPPVILCTWKAL